MQNKRLFFKNAIQLMLCTDYNLNNIIKFAFFVFKLPQRTK